MSISFEGNNDFRKITRALQRLSSGEVFQVLESAGTRGVNALRAATPVDTGATAGAWSYKVSRTGRSYSITWTNGREVGGAPLAIMLQYGHGTGTGGYVQGRDYINPAMRPVFDQIAQDVWKAVRSAWR